MADPSSKEAQELQALSSQLQLQLPRTGLGIIPSLLSLEQEHAWGQKERKRERHMTTGSEQKWRAVEGPASWSSLCRDNWMGEAPRPATPASGPLLPGQPGHPASIPRPSAGYPVLSSSEAAAISCTGISGSGQAGNKTTSAL